MVKNDAVRKHRKLHRIDTVVATIFCILFTGIIFMYYLMLYSAAKTNIIKNGEVTASNTADNIDLLLATNKDSVKLVAYALDEMITKGRSEEDIQDFLERQSKAKKSAIDPDSTGFYAYIYGRFFSGTRWVSPTGYDATTRPWYQKPFDEIGEVTVLDPYLDMQTGKRKLALGKVLCDGVSVVSMDLPTTPIQQMVLKSVKSGDADIALVISKENVVIAHSDDSEIGRDYDIVVNSLGATIANNLQGDEDYYFEFRFEGSHYIVYVAYIQSGLRCISIKNTSDIFGPLRLILFGTIVVELFGIIIIVFMIRRSNQLVKLYECSANNIENLDNNYSELKNADARASSTSYVKGDHRSKPAKKNIRLSTRIQWLVFTVLVISESLVCASSVLQSRSAVRASVRQRMIDIANCAAWAVDGDELKDLTADDDGTVEYQHVYDALAVFRDNIELEYVYGIKDEGDGRFTFTVDPTFGDPAEFGEEVVVTEGLILASQGTPAVDKESYSDRWGKFYSAYSPVRDSDGDIAGIIGVDFSKEWFEGQIDRQTDEILKIYLIILAVTVALSLLLCFLWIRSITGPLKYMTEVAVRYGEGDFSEKIEIESNDELGVLSHTLQTMSASLEEQVKKAEDANEAKSIFLANMSHEIRTPINTVLGMNEMILRESNEKSILFYAEKIKSAGNNLLSLINDILDFSKIESGKIELILQEYNLPQMLIDLVSMIDGRAENKGLCVNTSFDKELPQILIGDETRIKEVITNLLTNAVKYTAKGTITFKVMYEKIEEDPDSIVLKIAVSDTGIGIHKEDMERLFSKFVRLDEKKNRNIEGAGLGLNITQSLLELMDSKLQVESEYGKGSVFYFDLVQKVADWEPIGNYEESALEDVNRTLVQKGEFTAPDARILAVDDNDINLMVLANLFKRAKVKVDTADNADSCLRLVAENKYDLIFLDHMMPEKDGIEILHEVKALEDGLNKDTPIVCLTANAISGAKDFYIKQGFDSYLTKPINPELLEEMMLQFLPEDKVVILEKEDKDDSRKCAVDEREVFLPLYERGDVDVEKGISNNGSISAYLSIFGMFLERIEESAKEIDDLYKAQDIKNYTIKIHAIKSSARMIGAMNLGEDAQELENAGKRNDYDFIKGHHSEFVDNYRDFESLVSKMAEYYEQSSGDSKDKPVADASRMNKLYNDLKEAAENYDTIRIDELFEDISAYRVPVEEIDLFSKLKEAADAFDYAKIMELIPDGI